RRDTLGSCQRPCSTSVTWPGLPTPSTGRPACCAPAGWWPSPPRRSTAWAPTPSTPPPSSASLRPRAGRPTTHSSSTSPAPRRPANNPLIVHLAGARQVGQVAATWPQAAARLAQRFWPGPLTLVLPRGPGVPDVVTAGGPTVAVRVPAHPVAHALLAAAGVPL